MEGYKRTRFKRKSQKKNHLLRFPKSIEPKHLSICETNIEFQGFNQEMEEKISFENFFYEIEQEITINYQDFCIDRIIMLPKIRPHELEKAVRLSAKYYQNSMFHRMLLQKSNDCPVLIYRLHKQGVFVFEEIKPYLYSMRRLFILQLNMVILVLLNI